jgi:hypothetical protein
MPAIIDALIGMEREANFRPIPPCAETPIGRTAEPLCEEIIEWARENPWFFTDPEMAAAATSIHGALNSEWPTLTLRENLAITSAWVRAQFGSEAGLLHDQSRGWLNASGLGDLAGVYKILIAARPEWATFSAIGDDFQRGPSMIWFMPLRYRAQPVPDPVLAELVMTLDRGGVIGLAGPSGESVRHAKGQILRMAGAAPA